MKKSMKIGIIRETKIPTDNRVAFTPIQIKNIQNKYKDISFVIQKSDIRAYHDYEYEELGLEVKEDVSDSDILFGIKEAKINTLIPNKHYFFFGHIAKMQTYNKPLIKKMMELGITFTDYEYLVDENNHRLCAFGWWAGAVGAYNTLRAFGLRDKIFELPIPGLKFTLKDLIDYAAANKDYSCKIVVSGKGRSSQGVQFVLNQIGFKKLDNDEFLKNSSNEPRVYTVAYIDSMVKRIDQENEAFDRNHFRNNPESYKSDFLKFSRIADVYIPCHFWNQYDPIYLTEEDLRNEDMKIRVIGDVTCDIKGSIKSTVRSSTHDEPFYDYNPFTEKEEEAFSSDRNITVMAVDTLPNALALETSKYFGEKLMENIVENLLSENVLENEIIRRATILNKGELTDKYLYLKEFANQ